jgi:hypothetical protein
MLPNTYGSDCEKVHNFVCNECDFKCSRKWLWDRHISTPKHINTYNPTVNDLQVDCKKCYKCDCGTEYSHRQSLYNHKKKCKGAEEIKCVEKLEHNLQPTNADANIILQLIKQNSDFQSLILDQTKIFMEQNTKLVDTFSEALKHNSITNNVNQVNSHNKTFNLQVFLHEDCKDAMNMSDFLESLKIQLADVEAVGELGYVNGISKLIINNLKELDVTKRPVHCTDEKREIVYIKEAGVWTKDEDYSKLRRLIKCVSNRNFKHTRLYKEKHPDCIRSESKYSDTYNKIVLEATGGGSKCNDYESENKIMKKIAKVVTIDKSEFLTKS